jgi:hypothetical protein
MFVPRAGPRISLVTLVAWTYGNDIRRAAL